MLRTIGVPPQPASTGVLGAWVRPVLTGAIGPNREVIDATGVVGTIDSGALSCSAWSIDSAKKALGVTYDTLTIYGQFRTFGCENELNVACCAPSQ